MDPTPSRRQPEESYKIGSVRPSVFPSVLLSRRFLGIVSLVFSEFLYGARNPYEVMRDRAGFSANRWNELIFCMLVVHKIAFANRWNELIFCMLVQIHES